VPATGQFSRGRVTTSARSAPVPGWGQNLGLATYLLGAGMDPPTKPAFAPGPACPGQSPVSQRYPIGEHWEVVWSLNPLGRVPASCQASG
jgi:hypothetical protein